MTTSHPHRPIIIWLYSCCAMIFLMAVIGAITRLTESGLSITRWEPISGAIPPMNEAEWQHVFDLYRQSPQYRAINQGMELHEFKNIFFWEWIHRLWGRLIGVVYALPLAVFWLRGMIPQGFKLPLVVGFFLGGLQGFVGWFMVKSGLVEGMASVSAYRLAMHLALALGIYAFLFWQILRLKAVPAITADRKALNAQGWLTLTLISITIIWGALTAGLDAGKIYNSFPLMGGYVLPPDALAMKPAWLNFLENPAGVQFAHRVLAIITFISAVMLGGMLQKQGATKLGSTLIGVAILQVGLGIATLLTGVELVLAVAHQANAIVLLSVCVLAVYRTSRGASAVRQPAADQLALRQGAE